jgi:hypothetical protein
MRTISISTETFAAIWKAQEPGEASEETILRRLLGVPTSTQSPPERDLKVVTGFVDPRYNVVLPVNFEIFRSYHGKEYRAQAIQGFWYLNSTGIGYGSVNELSAAIGITNENAWANWFFLDESAQKKPLSEKRDKAKIIRRNKPATRWTDKSTEELGLGP